LTDFERFDNPAAAAGTVRWMWQFAAAGCWLLFVVGCGREPPRVVAPTIDAVAAGQEAIAEYDTNHDGAISGAELDQCPGLKSALKQYDNGTGRITAADITERIRKWQESRVSLSQTSILLTMDGKPLEGATVTAEPEKFLGSAIPSATGVTDSLGIVWLQIAQNKPGVYYGLYKLRVSKRVNGQETIPARYNARTELGFEKAPDAPGLKGHKLDLKSK
jgi:hypothetical protein